MEVRCDEALCAVAHSDRGAGSWLAGRLFRAQLTVLTSGGFRAPYQEALPAFEGASGIKVTTLSGASQGDGPNTIGAQLRRGVEADLVIMSKEGLLELARRRLCSFANRRLTWRRPRWAQRCAPARRPLTSAPSRRSSKRCWAVKGITFPGSTTGIYMMKEMFPKLGVADAIASRLRIPASVPWPQARRISRFNPVSELVHAPGARYIGPIPRRRSIRVDLHRGARQQGRPRQMPPGGCSRFWRQTWSRPRRATAGWNRSKGVEPAPID